MKKILNYINGELLAPLEQKFIDNINPATGQVYSLVPSSNHRDVELAIAAAEKAFPLWSGLPIEKRADYLRQISEAILKKIDLFAEAESVDNGKPMALARRLDIPRSATNFQFFADTLSQFHGETFRTNANTLNYTEYSPLGVVGCISPWNLPLYLLTWKIAPALAAGNTVVAKPSELTPMTAYLLSEVCREVHLPPGVLNIVHGLGAEVGGPLVESPRVKAISFTGSTMTGRQIAKSVAGQFKKLSLEMGGKNPNIIFADCDFEKALETTLRSSFLNQGQICLCGSRIFVEESIYEKFKSALIEKTRLLQIGDPLQASTDQGAVVSKAHFDKVMSYIELAKSEGGKILTGGVQAKLSGELAGGFFIQPTIIEGLRFDSRVNQEEIFGPVVTLASFKTESEVLQMANSTNYGLSASIWTQNQNRIQSVSEKLQAGIVWVNTWMNRDLRTPFGGVKESGYGREGGLEVFKFFSEVKNICIQSESTLDREVLK